MSGVLSTLPIQVIIELTGLRDTSAKASIAEAKKNQPAYIKIYNTVLSRNEKFIRRLRMIGMMSNLPFTIIAD